MEREELVPTSVQLPLTLRRNLEAEASRRGITRTSAIKEAVALWLDARHGTAENAHRGATE